MEANIDKDSRGRVEPAMAELLQSLPSFIKDSYGIQVAVRCSQDVEEICHKSHLSFCELLRPFSQLSTEGEGGITLWIAGMIEGIRM